MAEAKIFHDKQAADPTGTVHANSIKRTMSGESLPQWQMFTRESLQNSWDARDRTSSTDGVTYAIEYHELSQEKKKDLASKVFGDDFEGLEPLEELFTSDSPVSLLTVSDTGTVGLRGPEDASKVTDTPNDYVSFVRDVGRSTSKSLEGGTYGFGKAVFFLASRVMTILVYTRTTDENGNRINRFIATALGNDFTREYTDPETGTSDIIRYTGRHWWGRKETFESKGAARAGDMAVSLVGKDADELAARFGLDRCFTEERSTGTSITVIDPDIETPEEKLREIANFLVAYAWPHLIELDQGLDPLEFSITLRRSSADGTEDVKEIEIPDPTEDPALAYFVDAYEIALLEGEKLVYGKDEWKHQGDTALKKLGAGSGLKVPLGILSMRTNLDRFEINKDDTLLGIDISQHIALIRKPRMVIEYKHLPNPLDNDPFCGVFIADDHADPVFARSEPAAHHKWNEDAVANEDELLEKFWNSKCKFNPVRILEKHLKKSTRNPSLTIEPTGGGHSPGLTWLSDALGPNIGGLEGSGTSVPDTANTTGNSGHRGVRTASFKSEPDGLYPGSGGFVHSLFKVTAVVPNRCLPGAAKVTAVLSADNHVLKKADAEEVGIDYPELLGWSDHRPEAGETGNQISSDEIPLTQNETTFWVLVRQPLESAVMLNCTYEEKS